nr:hypothetical protein [uncultured archaeon]AQS33462.1 hypothetical protein [uncultured archaeon]
MLFYLIEIILIGRVLNNPKRLIKNESANLIEYRFTEIIIY